MLRHLSQTHRGRRPARPAHFARYSGDALRRNLLRLQVLRALRERGVSLAYALSTTPTQFSTKPVFPPRAASAASANLPRSHPGSPPKNPPRTLASDGPPTATPKRPRVVARAATPPTARRKSAQFGGIPRAPHARPPTTRKTATRTRGTLRASASPHAPREKSRWCFRGRRTRRCWRR